MTIEELQKLIDECREKIEKEGKGRMSRTHIQAAIKVRNSTSYSQEITGVIGKDIFGQPIIVLHVDNNDGDY